LILSLTYDILRFVSSRQGKPQKAPRNLKLTPSKTPLRGNALIAHGGGPTPVLNASLAGLIAEAASHPAIATLYGARFGAAGILKEDFVDLSRTSRETLDALRVAPGSAIGTSRHDIRPADYERMFDIFARHEIRYLFYTGGNGSMDTAMRIDEHASESGYDMRVIGVPKTIDNDLMQTDHSPGYASCARFFAHAVRDIGADNRALPPPIEVVEVLGRNVGWIVAATALARSLENDAPNLIYFPECPISVDRICADVEAVHRRAGRCLIAICEGQRDDQGGWFGAELNSKAGARDPLPGNMGHTLAKLIWSRTGLRTRAEKPGLFGRSCELLASEIDREEAFACGQAAIRAALAGVSGEMVAIRRVPGSAYRSETVTVPLSDVAGRERAFPAEWISPDKNDVAPQFIEWIRPLVGDVKPHVRL